MSDFKLEGGGRSFFFFCLCTNLVIGGEAEKHAAVNSGGVVELVRYAEILLETLPCLAPLSQALN